MRIKKKQENGFRVHTLLDLIKDLTQRQPVKSIHSYTLDRCLNRCQYVTGEETPKEMEVKDDIKPNENLSFSKMSKLDLGALDLGAVYMIPPAEMKCRASSLSELAR